MKCFVWIAVIAFAVGLTGCLAQSAKSLDPVVESQVPELKGERQPVLVELFTSEGCSSCPPADKVLTILQNDQLVPNADVITLGYHVDYWDHDGWKDRFSAHAYTNRQETYARQFKISGPYTPQIVVDGAKELVGSNRAQANDAVAASAANSKGVVVVKIDGDTLHGTVSGLAAHGDSTIFLAVAESKLVSNVSGGENSGSKLEHTAVVRLLAQIGNIKASDDKAKFEAPVPSDEDWKNANLKYVVFVQERATLKILAVNQVSGSK